MIKLYKPISGQKKRGIKQESGKKRYGAARNRTGIDAGWELWVQDTKETTMRHSAIKPQHLISEILANFKFMEQY